MNNNHLSPKRDTEYLTVRGRNLEIVWHGPGPNEAPTLIFLHEGLGCVDMWRDFPAKLAEITGCGSLVYSRLGYGRSDPCDLPRPTRYMHDEGLEVLPELIKAAHIRECILIGHSDGGSIALIYAGGTPAIPLRGMITEAAHVYCESINIQSIRQAKEEYLKGNLAEKLKKYHGANTECAFRGWNEAWLHPDFLSWNIEEYLPGINAPILIIQGEDDNYGTIAQVETIAEKTSGISEIRMLTECGHSPHKDRGDTVLEVMQRFIKKILKT
ncbi:MAG: alpha/beta hydrolase [Deltaproteobacteria bacterium]|nr:alpha/beta hydrolase [Deltaproteobacteria bacterium]